jgi:DUF4097 and DUF4098 domain-containing protein YvlB
MKRYSILTFIIFLISCTATINETVYVKDGEVRNKDITSINGGIIIGNDCKVHGSCRAVNGEIRVGQKSVVSELQSVNGNITVGPASTIRGDIEAVNGEILTDPGVQVTGDVSSINGNIVLQNTIISNNLETVNGDISLKDSTIVEKNIFVKWKSKFSDDKRQVDIYIQNGSRVMGNIEVEDKKISVRVYVSSDSKILGDVIDAEIIYQ